MGESLEYLRSRDLNAAEKYLRRVQLRNSLTTDLLSLSTKSGAIRSLSPGCNLMNWKYTEVHFSFYWPAQTKSKIRRNMRGPPCTGALYNNLSLSKSFSTKTQYHPDDGNFQHFQTNCNICEQHYLRKIYLQREYHFISVNWCNLEMMRKAEPACLWDSQPRMATMLQKCRRIKFPFWR